MDTDVVLSVDKDIYPDSSLGTERTRPARKLKIRKESLESVSQRAPPPSAAGVTVRSEFFSPPRHALVVSTADKSTTAKPDKYPPKASHTLVPNPENASHTASCQRYSRGG